MELTDEDVIWLNTHIYIRLGPSPQDCLILSKVKDDLGS